MSGSPALEVENLRKIYSEGWFARRRLEALRGVSFQVQRGEIFGLLGPNGAGKTTIIKILLGIARPAAGQARLLGQPAGRRAARREVGYLPEQLRLAPHHSAKTALEFYGRLSGLSRDQIRRRGAELLSDVGLQDRARDRLKKYSKGMLQRLGLAQALLHDPALLMLDEPTDGLDPVARSQVRNVLTRLRDQGKTVFLNSHFLQEVELVCDRVAILDRGELRFVGPVSDIISRATTHFELSLQLAGDNERVRQALEGRELLGWTTASDDTLQVKLRAGNQAEVDAIVDRLRQTGASIIALAPRRMTLEDAFLDLLKAEAT